MSKCTCYKGYVRSGVRISLKVIGGNECVIYGFPLEYLLVLCVFEGNGVGTTRAPHTLSLHRKVIPLRWNPCVWCLCLWYLVWVAAKVWIGWFAWINDICRTKWSRYSPNGSEKWCFIYTSIYRGVSLGIDGWYPMCKVTLIRKLTRVLCFSAIPRDM